jgi:hypothetical protein
MDIKAAAELVMRNLKPMKPAEIHDFELDGCDGWEREAVSKLEWFIDYGRGYPELPRHRVHTAQVVGLVDCVGVDSIPLEFRELASPDGENEYPMRMTLACVESINGRLYATYNVAEM